MAAFTEIQSIFREEMPVIPIRARHVVTGASGQIGNYNPSPIVPYSLWNADDLFEAVEARRAASKLVHASGRLATCEAYSCASFRSIGDNRVVHPSLIALRDTPRRPR